MRVVRSILVLMFAFAALFTATAQNPPAGAGQRGGGRGGEQRGGAAAEQRGGAPGDARGGRGGRGGGGQGGIQFMNVTSTAWPDGGLIPLRYTQVGGETSPGVQWSNVPQGTASFVVLFHDLDALVNPPNPPAADGTPAPAKPPQTLTHWLMWNIPPTTTNIPPGRADGFELEDKIKQISASGFRYRGPGAPAAGPFHHYVLEVYALDTMLDIPVVAPSPQGPNPNVPATREAVFNAMAGHIRGKGTYVGIFHRPQ